MQVIKNLVIRNIRNYIRDKASLFFSMFSIIILLLLYVLFLADLQASNIMNWLADVPGVIINENDVSFMINGWLIAGLLAVNSITMPLFILSGKVEDRYKKIDLDLNATPTKRYQIVLGYIITAWIVGMLSSVLILIVGEVFIVIKGGSILSALAILKVLGVLSLSIVMSSGMFYIIIIFLKTSGQVTAVNSLIGTTVGFIGGIYVPLGFLGFVGTAAIFFPLAHTAAILRQIFMQDSMNLVFTNAPEGLILAIREFLGVDLVVGSFTFSTGNSLLFITGFALVSYIVAIILYTKFKNK